jgi:electron transfer flavoprotein alpha subunit
VDQRIALSCIQLLLFMSKILFLAHTESDGSLAKPHLEALQTARRLSTELPGTSLVAGLVGESVQAAAESIANCGAARFLGVAGSEFAQGRYATDAAALEAIGRVVEPTLVVAAGTSRWNRVLPAVAHRLKGRADTHVTGCSVVEGSVQIERWYYRQRMQGVLQSTPRPWFLLIDPGSQPAWSGANGTVAPELLSVPLTEAHQRTTVTGIRAPAANAQTIRPDAELLFVAGAGWTKKQPDGKIHAEEAERLILGFLTRTRSSLGSSKSLVDLGGEGQPILSFLTHMNQVGQTGSTPRHPKGLAACCHGEEPHTVGWRFVNERRAINLDPNCGWARGKADVLYVADAFAVLATMNELLVQGHQDANGPVGAS